MVLEALTTDPHLSQQVLAIIASRANFIFAIFSQYTEIDLKMNCLALFFNMLDALDCEAAKDLVLSHAHFTQIFFQSVRDLDSDTRLEVASLECLEKMLLVGAAVEEENPDGDQNPLVRYCQEHYGLDVLERAKEAGNARLREIAGRIAANFFTN